MFTKLYVFFFFWYSLEMTKNAMTKRCFLYLRGRSQFRIKILMRSIIKILYSQNNLWIPLFLFIERSSINIWTLQRRSQAQTFRFNPISFFFFLSYPYAHWVHDRRQLSTNRASRWVLPKKIKNCQNSDVSGTHTPSQHPCRTKDSYYNFV